MTSPDQEISVLRDTVGRRKGILFSFAILRKVLKTRKVFVYLNCSEIVCMPISYAFEILLQVLRFTSRLPKYFPAGHKNEKV